MRYRQNTKGDILYGPPVSLRTVQQRLADAGVKYSRLFSNSVLSRQLRHYRLV